MLPAKRSKKTTLRQYEIMLDFLENHPEMISGKTTDSFTPQRREKLWSDLSVCLNSVSYGPQKTPAKWRKVSTVKVKLSYFVKIFNTFISRARLTWSAAQNTHVISGPRPFRNNFKLPNSHLNAP